MATTKTAAKKAPSKPVFRTDYKAGTRVKVKTRSGDTITGRVVEVFTKQTGPFVKVNVGDSKKPLLKDYRPAVVKGY